MMLNDFIGKQYEDGARGPERFDCWGLVRAIRHEVYGLPLLSSFGHVRHTMPKEFTKACLEVSSGLTRCEPETGAVAAVFRGHVCVHVAVVVEIDGDLAVMEINPGVNCQWLRIPDFERQHLRVEYYRD
ncbi:hypothetical protein KP003_16615 [Geomonas nitrogeniifigens]|uniref:hypothetical protein n=1 Tax=Geomonas diazotrophica TaxID=2843197 RepID=UPI001C2C3994|nr:hypothetical protein [Geomonas nitrogeniifigens]QXE85964.1 hypothetical protein KP003_16615 [Geomonas nitrogeniifigens]